MKILIVEDDVLTARMIADWMAPLAGEVRIAHTMQEATDYIEACQEPPELITLDLGLPDSDRAATIGKIRGLRKRAPDTLLVVISGIRANADECIAGGADAYFEKLDVSADGTFMAKLRALVLELTRRRGGAETHLRLLEAVSAHMAAQGKECA